MLDKDYINNEYFEWMYNIICGGRFAKSISYRKVLMKLHDTEFKHPARKDRGRDSDGIKLRYRFPYEQYGIEDIERYISGPCSMLEMMLALAIHCEESIMDNPAYGDRTAQWFWIMMNSLGLGSMADDLYDRDEVEFIIKRFLRREYEPNGRGGLFTIRHCKDDLRNVEIWTQMCWYLNTIS